MKTLTVTNCLFLGAATALVLLSSCACGNAEGTPCTNPSGCPSGFACAAGKCTAAKGPDGGPLMGGMGGGTGAGGGPGGTGGGSAPACVNLQCRQVMCPSGGTTSISGTVFAPNGTLPIYNAVVYVPNEMVQPFPAGVSCDKCGSNLSGSPVVQKLTDTKGQFKLDNVPAGDNVPVVIQVGRWRRQITIPKVAECQDTVLDAAQTRLPKNKSEGDMPQMAIATGNADPFECLLQKIGVDDAEVTTAANGGKVHYFRYNGVELEGGSPNGSEMVNSLDTLKKYDVVMLPCEGNQNTKPDLQIQNLVDYANLGGRVFATHYSYSWVRDGLAGWPQTANWQGSRDSKGPDDYDVNTAFAKGNAFADWLFNVKATPTRAVLPIIDRRTNVRTVNSSVAQSWITLKSKNPETVGHYTFNTPVSALLPDGGSPDQCGRVVFSDFHVAANAKIAGEQYPKSCKPGEMTGQEKALAFMLFDLSGCVQRDEVPPDIN
jgi:hypothetical protein